MQFIGKITKINETKNKESFRPQTKGFCEYRTGNLLL